MTDEEKKVAAAKKKENATSTFRNSTTKAISDLKAKNKKLTSEAMANKNKTIAANRKKARSAKRKKVTEKYTRISGLQGLQGLQGLSQKK